MFDPQIISDRRTHFTATCETRSAEDIRADLLAKREIALLDVREEAIHATGHPLFAANLPLSQIEIEAYTRIPRRNAPIVVFDDGEGLASPAVKRLREMGYEDVCLLKDGLEGWRDAGFEIFRDVNVPSKAFGELVETKLHTPSLSAQEVKKLIDSKANIVIVDVRRFDEFRVMSIPTAVSVPGAEVVLRIRELAQDPNTTIIVNCAGRTRSIIGTQSLINAGMPNRIFALRNGTIGWTLAGQELLDGESRTFGPVSDLNRFNAAQAAHRVAAAAGVERVEFDTLSEWIESGNATVYRFDVRSPGEYEAGHLPGFRNAPGGQLVQETDMFAPVRGATIALADSDGTRANMTGSWLAQMGWRVFVVNRMDIRDFTEQGPWQDRLPLFPDIPEASLISSAVLHRLLDHEEAGRSVVIDLAPSRSYQAEHIPKAWFALRSRLADVISVPDHPTKYVLTSSDGIAARFAWPEVRALTQQEVFVLEGGNRAWSAAGLPMESAPTIYASAPIDRYRRPYEGTDASRDATQAYLDWEYGLVDQLNRDGTHGFQVLE